MTIGDVLAAIAAVFVLVGSSVAAMLVSCMAFPKKVQAAKVLVTSSPTACGFRGFFIIFIVAVVGRVLTTAPFGGAKLLGLLIISALVIPALLGGSAIVDLIADRMVSFGTQFSRFTALTRSGILYGFACLLPGAGWFLILPLCLCISVGAGVGAIRQRDADRNPPPIGVIESASGVAQ
jgi:hypothetical protein